MRVLIIGGGLGGLTLAHGLLKEGIEVQVFERSATPNERPASYGLHLAAGGLIALHNALPAANWRRLIEGTVPARDVVRFTNPIDLHVLGLRNKEFPENTTDPVTRRRAVSRDVLRDALLIGLNIETRRETDVIQWGKKFFDYKIEADGTVTAHFADGTSSNGDLLVGADGSNSRVRKQLLPGLERLDRGIVNIAGRAPLTPALQSALPTGMTDGSVVNLVPNGRGWLFCSTWPVSVTERASVGADAYMIWACVGSRDDYPKDPEKMTTEELKLFVQQRITRWAPGIRTVIAGTAAETLAPVVMRSMPQLNAWNPSQVTVLGDAIHNMTPLAGIGANTALRDAETMRAALTMPGAARIIAQVGTYETNMRTYANEALALSTSNARNAVGDKTIGRRAFRTMLRIGRKFPPVNKLMFGPSPMNGDR
jgi:2-polyprenyl-6-methoxyphenol hydroxylase-like FAD-dependent oxidoreductase